MRKSEQRDHLLCQYELARYGVSYLDESDTLFIGRPIRRDASGDAIIHTSPCGLLQLFYDPDSSECFGACVSQVTPLVACYLNCRIPEVFPAVFIADLLSLCVAEPESPLLGLGDEVMAQVVELHRCARLLFSGVGTLPEPVIDRIKNNLDFSSTTVH